MRCLVFAYSEIGVESLQTLLDAGDDVVGVVTHKDNPNEVRWFRSVEEWAAKKNVPVITPEDANTPEVLAWGRDREPDIVFSFYYRKMLKKPWLELAKLGAYNLHGSLLPKFRGRAPINWAIIEGATETGLTLHAMVEKPDAGDIIIQEAVPIRENDTAREVFEKVVPLARHLLTQAVPLLREWRAPRRPQDPALATYFGARRPEDGQLDWRWSARRVHNMVRALTRPYPGAFTWWNGRKLFIWKGRALASPAEGKPAHIGAGTTEGVPVSTGDGIYLVKEVQWDGGPIQPATEVLTPALQLDVFECAVPAKSS